MLGGEVMTGSWYHIAKAEFYVMTSGFRKHRAIGTVLLYTLATVWASYLAPMIIVGILEIIMPMDVMRTLLMVMFPGLMRTVILFLWALLLLYPLSYSLQEIKIGQWEIYLSNDVKTKDILAGTFLGKMPLYGLIVILVAPVLISPFMAAFEVPLLGQMLVYASLAFMVISTLWLANFLTSIIQARLGDSSRGNDIAKALSFVIALVVIIPMYGLMFFMPQLSELLGMDAFLIMPFTWPADLVSWIAITFNGIGLTGGQIIGFASILKFDIIQSAILTVTFGFLWVPIAIAAADRIFTIGAGARTESVTTVGRDNIILRGIRRVAKGPFGALTIVSLKDFGRKAQNLSKIFYGVVLAIILPIIIRQMSIIEGEIFVVDEILPMISIMIGIVGVFPFAGTGFLESKDQLWIIRSAPKGASRFMRARLATGFLMAVPLSGAPTIAMIIMFALPPLLAAQIFISAYIVVCGAVMIAMGATAQNPDYEDTKSPAHQTVLMTSMLLTEFTLLGPLFLDLFLTLGLGIDVLAVIESVLHVDGLWFMITIVGPSTLLFVGLAMMTLGIRSLGKVEV
ncbi:MAG: hypothetical protein EAX81_06655 [Candidatus Thorarchaeota archaeon]|nr:hypothetical protein [Candidatus Thorarchaeota archaeon]